MWTNALDTVEAAVSSAVPGDRILIAEGVYTPVVPASGDPRNATFLVTSGVALQGGFLGIDGGPNASTTFNQPDGSARATILSGNIGDPTLSTDNCYSVVTVTGGSSTYQLVSNLTIRDGYADRANGVGFEVQGGGLYAIDGSIELRDVIFEDNHAGLEGGALYFDGDLGYGYGLTRCFFKDNTANDRGGACYLTFPDGGAVSDHDVSWVFNCIFVENHAGVDPATVAGAGGGAVWHDFRRSKDVEFANNIVLRNTTRGAGSAYVFKHNSLSGSGALRVTNDTVYDNEMIEGSSNVPGDAVVFFGFDDTSEVSNSIVWANRQRRMVPQSSPPAYVTLVAGISATAATVEYSDVETGFGPPFSPPPTVFPGIGNIHADPLFDVPGLRLRAGSPCIDVGDVTALPLDYGDVDNGTDRGEILPKDTTSEIDRVIGLVGGGTCGTGTTICGDVDMGAYERN